MSQTERQKIGRNEQCWCKSGKKFKNCHMNRVMEERTPYHELATDLKKTQIGERRCLYPLKGSPCKEPVIKAHSISKVNALALIARDGHVYQPNADPFAIKNAHGEILHHLVGIQLATTFTGFCQVHDHQLFKPIDEANLQPTLDQVFLLHYRALCRELYVKRPTLISNRSLRRAGRGRSAEFEAYIHRMIDSREAAIATSILELESEKLICDAAIQMGDLRGSNALVLYFDATPTIACSGLTQPIYDFSGNELQDLANLRQPLSRLSFTLLPSSNGGMAVIAWQKHSDDVCRKFVTSFLNIRDDLKCSALVQWVFDSFENHAFEPLWWESLPQAERNELELIQTNWTDAAIFIDSASIVPTGRKFADWRYREAVWM